MGTRQSTDTAGGDGQQKVIKGMLIAVLILSIINMLIWIALIGIGISLASTIADKVDEVSDDIDDATDTVEESVATPA